MKQKFRDINCNCTKIMWQLVEQRKIKEKNPTKHVIFAKNTKVFLKRGASGNILSFNDSFLYHTYHEFGNCYGMWAYSNLSKKIHEKGYKSKRGMIESEIDKLVQSKEFTFLKVRGVLSNGVVNYFNQKKLPLPKKRIQNRIYNLCNQFVAESPKFHYRLSKHEKSLIKRLSKKPDSYWQEREQYSIYKA